MRNKFVFIFFFSFLFMSCEAKYNLSQEKSTVSQIIEDLNNKKVIFIGENHDNIYPVLLITDNLNIFYNSGLRYIFLESGDDGVLSDSNLDSYSFDIVPPWTMYAWKYELHLLEEQIQLINSNNPADPIKVYWPEYNLAYPISENATEVLNFRDNNIQRYIIDILDDSKEQEKAIVFYGAGHGAKRPAKYAYGENSDDWIMLGCYLSDYYGEDYSSHYISYLEPEKLANAKSECVILSGKNLEMYVPAKDRDLYDYVSVSSNRTYGVTYPYIFSSENISFLQKEVQCFSDEFYLSENKWYNVKNLLALYYLKYWAEDYFDFSYEGGNHLGDLLKSVDFSKITPNSESLLSLTELEDYMEVLYSYGLIEEYLYNPKNDKRIDIVLSNVEKAELINEKDIWPKYWKAYFLTEQALYSDKESDYNKALSEWNVLLNNQLIYASPVLKLVYEKIAMCYEKVGNSQKKYFFRTKAENVFI
ncbi:MAG: hypothetical protein HUK25_06780, partial [Treponema sp.]|nr:hypothetical protein [Treponema sp.]